MRYHNAARYIVLLGVVLLSVGFPLVARSAASVRVTATVVKNTSLVSSTPRVQLKGFIAPNVAFTVTRDGTIVTTGTTDISGAFDILLTDQPSGQHIYVVSATDAHGQLFAPVTFAFMLDEGTITIVSNIFPGPSIGVNKPEVKLGQQIILSGATLPGSTVALTVNSKTQLKLTASVDSLGNWLATLATDLLGAGTHTATAIATSHQSVSATSEITFVVNPLEKCDGKKTADLNCDSKVNLTDFSILLYFWKKTTPANPRADINGDGIVSLVDFSIMLYQWTG